MNALEIKDLSKSYKDKEVLKRINLAIPQGSFFGLLGQNGAGKSTTINCVTGVTTPSNGTIEVFGKDVIKDYQEARGYIGLAPQEFNMDIFATPEVILTFVGGYYGMRKKEIVERMDELFDLLGLQEHRKKQFRQLSGGLKRRVALARALIHNPELLILDEPTAGVDVEQRHELWGHLQELHKRGKTIILTSHYLEEVEHLCERVAILHQGKILEEIEKADFGKEGGTLESTYLSLTKAK
jgi:ABC-2 type transport system ATP-binding protein